MTSATTNAYTVYAWKETYNTEYGVIERDAIGQIETDTEEQAREVAQRIRDNGMKARIVYQGKEIKETEGKKMFGIQITKDNKIIMEKKTDYEGVVSWQMWFVECHQAGDGYQMTVSYNGQVITSAA